MNEIEELERRIAEEAKRRGVRGIGVLFESLKRERCPPDVLVEVLGEVLKQMQRLEKKWYQNVRIAYLHNRRRWIVEFVDMSPDEIGDRLEDLVEVVLGKLGCEVLSPDRSLKLRSGTFRKRGIIFQRHPKKKHMVDFEGLNVPIAIEVKNWDPTISKSDGVVHSAIFNRFKGIRNKRRYLLIPGASPSRGFPFSQRQMQMLSQRGINEINFKEQLRWNNQKGVYKSLYRKLGEILTIHPY